MSNSEAAFTTGILIVRGLLAVHAVTFPDITAQSLWTRFGLIPDRLRGGKNGARSDPDFQHLARLIRRVEEVPTSDRSADRRRRLFASVRMNAVARFAAALIGIDLAGDIVKSVLIAIGFAHEDERLDTARRLLIDLGSPNVVGQS